MQPANCAEADVGLAALGRSETRVGDGFVLDVARRHRAPLLQLGDGQVVHALLKINIADRARKAVDLVAELHPVGFHM